MEIENYDEKAQELKRLIREAVHESLHRPTSPLRSVSGVFKGFREQTHNREVLADVLATTDALYVLKKLVDNG